MKSSVSRLIQRSAFIAAIASASSFSAAVGAEPTFFSCNFEKLPTMLMAIRGGVGASNNTHQVGNGPPVELSMSSNIMIAEYGAQEFVFALRLPASVKVSNAGFERSTMTNYGECFSTLPR
jgi:hypothetical protein